MLPMYIIPILGFPIFKLALAIVRFVIQDVEERERAASLTSQRNESELVKCKRENQHFQDRIVELESQLRFVIKNQITKL
jgi:hypothetical protein